MTNLNALDANTEPLPAGTYAAEVVKTELTPVGYESREYLEITFEIIEGPYAGRRLSRLFDPVSPHRLARSVYRAEIIKICQAVDAPAPQNWADPSSYIALHNVPLVITVSCEIYPDAGITMNRVIAYAKKD